MLENHILKSSR